MNEEFADDAFGQALLACHNQETTTYVVERDDNYIEASDLSVYFDVMKQKFGPDFDALNQLQPAMRVLDIGCGAGRHALYLQERGVSVTGIDKSPLGIEVCRMRGVKDARVIPIEEMGIMLAGEQFDAVIMLGHNFGLFGSFDKAQQLLATLASITTPGAKILATSRNPKSDNPFHVRYQEQNVLRGRMPAQVRLRIRFRGFVSSWLDYLFVSEADLQRILTGTPWCLEETKYSYDNRGSSYLMVLGKR